MMDMQTIIADWKANAERHADRNFGFLRSLKMKNERAVDRAARRTSRRGVLDHRLHPMCQLLQDRLAAVLKDGHSPDCRAPGDEGRRTSRRRTCRPTKMATSA